CFPGNLEEGGSVILPWVLNCHGQENPHRNCPSFPAALHNAAIEPHQYLVTKRFKAPEADRFRSFCFDSNFLYDFSKIIIRDVDPLAGNLYEIVGGALRLSARRHIEDDIRSKGKGLLESLQLLWRLIAGHGKVQTLILVVLLSLILVV